jgi:hypothetical protein
MAQGGIGERDREIKNGTGWANLIALGLWE